MCVCGGGGGGRGRDRPPPLPKRLVFGYCKYHGDGECSSAVNNGL